MAKIQVMDVNTGEIILEEVYANNRWEEMLKRFSYLCFVSTKDKRIELYQNNTRVCAYNFGGNL